MRRLIIVLLIFILNCRVFEIRLQNDVNESNVEVVPVPQTTDMFPKERDLTELCKGKKLVYVKFFHVGIFYSGDPKPREVWCK
ncbi:MAG: hypothetical protein KDK90_28165 [Leptospiraceae bacterium]|nr:hypothetical protein [Leptospiraceae bacterium]